MKRFLEFALGSVVAVLPLRATTLSFEPADAFRESPAGTLPGRYGQQVAGADQDGFAYGAAGGFTPEVRLSFGTRRLETDRPGAPGNFGLRVIEGGWNHPRTGAALVVLQADNAGDQHLIVRLRGSDTARVLLRGFDLVGRGGAAATVPAIAVDDLQLTTLFLTNDVRVPATGAMTLRFDPPLAAAELAIRIQLGRTPPPVGLDNVEFGQEEVAPGVWTFETVARPSATGSCPDRAEVSGLAFDPQDRAVLAWSEFNGCGGAGTGWWARREAGQWQVRQITASPHAPSFTAFGAGGVPAFTLSSNGVPFLFHAVANFGWDSPYMLARVNLDQAPQGPGVVVHGFGGGSGPDLEFGADGRASMPPAFVAHTGREPILLGGTSPISSNVWEIAGELVFRQGPERQVHVLYQKERDLVYNAGAIDREQAILRINAGASPHALVVDDANGLHVSAAQGDGLSYFGAVGRLAYLYSADGRNWTTHLLGPADVGATSIALDAQGRPAIAFTRGFSALYLTRLTESGWTPPTLVRAGLGGWDRSRSVKLAFDAKDVPHIAMYDELTRRTLVAAPRPVVMPADLAVSVRAETNRVAVTSTNRLVVTVSNAGSRNAAYADATVALPPEVVVRDCQPRPSRSEGSTYTFELGTLQAYEARDLVFSVTALDPVRLVVEATMRSDAPEANPDDNATVATVADFLPVPCLTATPPADCGVPRLLPERLPPAVVGHRWSLDVRVPLADPRALLRVAAGGLPPGYCLTADGQLRGVAGPEGDRDLVFELVQPGGQVLSFTRTLTTRAAPLPAGLVGFWPLDGDGRDAVGGNPGIVGARTVFLPGAVGLAAQSGRDILNDPRDDLANPLPLFQTPAPLEGVAFGERPVTLAGWFRRDGGAKLKGDPAPRGALMGLAWADVWSRERYVVLNPASGRLEVLDGPPDFRANVLSGPVVPPNVWHHLALVCEGRRTRLFVNGALVADGNFPQPLADRLGLLAGSWAVGGGFSGGVDEVALFNRALTTEEIVALRDQPLPRVVPLPPGGSFPLAPLVHELVLPDAVEGQPYEAAVSGGFCGAPVRFASAQDGWPTGLQLTEAGVVRGTPEVPGAFGVRIRAWDAAGNEAGLLARLLVKPGPPIFTNEPADQQVDFGGTLMLLAETRVPATFQWYFNGRELPGQTQPLLIVHDFAADQAGVYQVLAGNLAGFTSSREVTVGITVPVAAQQGVGLSDVGVRADGLVRLRVATLRGRIYELQRAVDLTLPPERRWQTVQRFVATGDDAELQDLAAGRPDAAFYRVVETTPAPPAAYSLADETRFLGLANDGQPRRGLLPFQDPATGRLGPFELRLAGDETPPGVGLCLRFPQGAQPVVTGDGGTQLAFRQGELFFGDESPLEIDEPGGERLVIDATSDVTLPAGPLTVGDLERLLGKPPGSGIRVILYRQFKFRLLRGTFEGDRIRQAKLAWVESGALRPPTPEESADFPDFDLRLTATRIRLAYHGEFALADGTGSPARLTVPATKPLWLELGPGGQVSLSGTVELSFAGGPAFTAEVMAVPPDYRLAVRAKGIRVPETLSLSSLLPELAPWSAPAPGEGGRASLEGQEPPDDLLVAALREAEFVTCASQSLQRLVAGSGAAGLPVPAAAGGASEAESDPVSERLDLFSFWSCVIGKFGYGESPEEVRVRLLREMDRLLASPATDFGGLVDRGGGFAFELHARMTAEFGALALQAPDRPELVRRAQAAYTRLREVGDAGDCEGWDPTSLERGFRALAQIRSLDPDERLFPPGAWRDFEAWTARILECNARRLARELGVGEGEPEPYNNPSVNGLKRYEARARLEEVLKLLRTAELAGVRRPVVLPELVSQLVLRIWADLGRQLDTARNACDVRLWRHLQAEVLDVIEANAFLEDSPGTSPAVAALPDGSEFAAQLGNLVRHCGETTVVNAFTSTQTDLLRPEFLADDVRVLHRLLLEVPRRLRQPVEAVDANLRLVRDRIALMLDQPLRRQQLRVAQLVELLDAGLTHDRLILRFRLPADRLVLGTHLSTLRLAIRDKARQDRDAASLARASRLLVAAARLVAQDAAPRAALAGANPPALDPEAADWRRAVAVEAHELARTQRELAAEAALAHDQAGFDLPDIRLPGGLAIEDAVGELAYHTQRRELGGRLGGTLRLPGAGLTLALRNAAFSSGGSFAGELVGSLDLPPANPAVSVRIPTQEPARFEFTRGRGFRLSGGGRLRFPGGAEVGCFLALDHPVYRFSASASGLRVRLAKESLDRIGLPSAARVPEALGATALEYLTRAGLLLDELQPDATSPAEAVGALTDPGARIRPRDSDDVAATAAALKLVLVAPQALNPRPAAALHAAGQPDPNAVALLKQLATQLDRHASEFDRDADDLSELDLALLGDATRVPPAEVAETRGPKLVEVARRLGAFGVDYQNALGVLRVDVSQELLGAAGLTDLDTLLRPYFENYAGCLFALRTNLVAWGPLPAVAPPREGWLRGPHWDRGAAEASLEAMARFLQTVQTVGYPDLALNERVRQTACLIQDQLLTAELEGLGLDPSSGGIPAREADRATYHALDRAEAIEGLRRLIGLAAADQRGLCGEDPRIQRAIPAMALRARDRVVAQLHAIQDQFDDPFSTRSQGRPWEYPEALVAAGTNLFAVLATPAALGLTQYPETTYRLRRGLPPPQHETHDPAVDAADAVAVLGGALTQLESLLQDERSGYPAELRRRRLAQRGAGVPAAELMEAFAVRFANLGELAGVRQSLARLARLETSTVAVDVAQAGFAERARLEAVDLVRRVLNLARLIHAGTPAGGGSSGAALAGGGDPALDQLSRVVLPQLASALAADPGTPWWVHGGVAEALLQASGQAWTDDALRAALRTTRIASQNAAQQQVAALLETVRSRVLPFDLNLPGELEIQRLYGGVLFNVQTHFVQVELGGRVEFPLVKTVDGKAAYFDLRRLRLESNGSFAFSAASRGPLPFADASFEGQVEASGAWPNRSLALTGEGELTFAAPPVNPETGEPFAPRLGARLVYEPLGYDAEGQPEGWRFAFHSSGAFRQSFGTHLAVFGAGAGFTVGRTAEGQPLGGVSVGGSVGLIRKPDRLAINPPGPEDFELVIEDAGIEIAGVAGEGGSAAITRGTLRLPEWFHPADLPAELDCGGTPANRTGATIAIRDPIRLSYEVGSRPRLEGVLRFSHLGLRVPRVEFLSFVLCEADLGLDGEGRPFLEVARAGMLLDLPWDKGVIRLQNLHLGFDGQVRGELLLEEDFDLFKAGEFRATLLGVPSLANPATPRPGGCRGTQLVLEDVPGFAAPRLTLAGAVRVELPLAAISNTDGSRVGGVFCGGIRVEPTERGPELSAFVDELAFEGEFGFGSPNVRLRNARIAARNFAGILQPNSEQPFLVSLSGDLQTGPFTFGLSEAQLRYLGPDRLPGFALEAVRFAQDATRPPPPPLNLLPFAVDFAEFRFKNPLADINALLRPENLKVTVSGRIGLPTVEKAFLRGGVSGVVFEFNPDGTPIPPAIDGFDLAVSGTADLKLPLAGDLGGRLRVGGLQRALRDGPQHIYFVGNLGTTMQGYKLNLLGAFTLAGPVGLCLDVSLGGAGLILSPTPFQILGASGGFAFLTTDDPCDFTQYFVFNPATGIYQLKQTIELPSLPIGMSWVDFTRVVTDMQERAAAFAGNFEPGTIPLPGPVGGAALADTRPDDPAPAALNGSGGGGDGGGAFGCPTNCPPPTVGLLCQPHPDRQAYASRVIFKFSSIPESVVNADPPAGLGIRRDNAARLGRNADEIGAAVASRLVQHLAAVLPGPGDGVVPGKLEFLADQQAAALEGVDAVTRRLVAQAMGETPNLYTALTNVLYQGVPCPDLTLALGGKVSMVGLSSFGWIEGRQVSSLSGSGGVIGELHVLGVPVGEARAFIASTDANGDPNPSLCGEAQVSLGPLDLGQADLALQCEGCVTELLRLFPTLATAVGEPFLRESLGRLAPELTAGAATPTELVRRVQRLAPGEQLRVMLGLFSDVQGAAAVRLPGNLADIIRSAVAATWDRINPRLVLCGEIQPRLFGLPLTLGGRTAALNFLTTKEGYLGEFAFSPGNLCPLFPPGDEAAFSFALRLRDPYTVLLGAFDGRLNDPDDVALLIKEQVEYALQNQILAAQYQWHPFGLELGDAAVRFLLPDVFDHPALPGRSWVNPDARAAEGLPSRDEVLVHAAATGKLGRAFDWLGDAGDLSTIFEGQDPRGAALRTRQLALRHDYFPHGGMVGGAKMALPRILMVHPTNWTVLYQEVVAGTDLARRFAAGMQLLNDYILKTETNGTAAFYVPAPNPPILYRDDGEPLEEQQVEGLLREQPEAFTAEALMRQLRTLGANEHTLRYLYPDELAFLRAEMTNLTVLGVPVFGTARLTGRPTPARLLDGQPLARLEFDVESGSWLGRVAGGGFAIDANLYATPDRSIVEWATELAGQLREEQAGDGRAPVRLAGGLPTPAALDRLRLELAGQLPRFAFSNALPAVRVGDPREWAGAPASTGSGPPGGFGGIGKSVPSTPLLVAELELLGFSPLYDPSAPGSGPVAAARREGGFAARGRLEFLPESPGRTGAGLVELSLTPSADRPRLRGLVRELNLPTPFPGLNLNNAQAEFDSQGNPFLRAGTTLNALDFGPLFRLEPAAGGSRLAGDVTLGHRAGLGGTRLPRVQAELGPARLTSALLGGRGLVLHGPTGTTSRFTVSEGGWDGRLSVVPGAALAAGGADVVLRATLAGARRDVLRIAGLPAQPFTLRGTGLDNFTLRFASPTLPSLTIELFPGLDLPALPARTLELTPPVAGAFEFQLASDGTFSLVGRLARDLPAGAHGVFAAGAEVRVDQSGATISGTVGAATGTLRLGEAGGRITVQFSAQLTLPRLCALGNRVCFSGPEGGDLVVTGGPGGLCADGAVLTVSGFVPGAAPLRYTLPAFCLDASRNFANLSPASGAALHGSSGTLPIGGFLLEGLRNLRVAGGFNTRRITLGFDADLRLGTLFSVPVSGTLGTDGLRFSATSSSLNLLGFDFGSLRLGVTNATGELPAVAFAGRFPALPAPLNSVEFAGDLPGGGAFELQPALPLSLPTFVPGFALNEVRPAFQYRPRSYVDVVRAATPNGFWRLDDSGNGAADSRRSLYFGPIAPRDGEYLGNVQRLQPGVPQIGVERSVRFDGSSAWVRLPGAAASPTSEGFAVSLWFRRGNTAVAFVPQTLAGRATQWSLQLRGDAAQGTRLHWWLNGAQNLDGAPLAALSGRTRFGVDDTLWHHVVAVYDGAAQWLYLDGRLDGWQPVRGLASQDVAPSVPASLGALSNGSSPTEFFNGWLDEVAVFSQPLGPAEALGHWLAAGRAGLTLGGLLSDHAIPGLVGATAGGLLGPNGDLALELSSAQAAEFGGVRLPAFRALLVRSGGVGAATFRSQIGLPRFDAQPLATARGFLGSDGRFVAQADAFEARGMFGWDLHLDTLTVSGNWRTPALQADLAGSLRLPYNIASFSVSGRADPSRNQYTLTGNSGGGFNLGALPFSVTGAPKLTDRQFEVAGTLALGTGADSARFGTTLKVTQDGGVTAAFAGTTGWVNFGAVTGHGQVRWTGQLEYVNGWPQVGFDGELGLSWPDHPASLDALTAGYNVVTRRDCLGTVCVDTPVAMTLRLGATAIDVDRRGRTSLDANPLFRDRKTFGFALP